MLFNHLSHFPSSLREPDFLWFQGRYVANCGNLRDRPAEDRVGPRLLPLSTAGLEIIQFTVGAPFPAGLLCRKKANAVCCNLVGLSCSVYNMQNVATSQHVL